MSTELKEIHDSHGAEASMLDAGPRLTGLLGEFDGVASVVTAAQKDAGRRIQGLGRAQPVSDPRNRRGDRNPSDDSSLAGALRRIDRICAAGLGLQWFCNAYDYPLLVSGKPLFSLPANIPIIFECTVLFSALTAVFGMLGLNRLPLLYNPLFKSTTVPARDQRPVFHLDR